MRQRKPDIYERADAAIASGELWRAKEILRGSIRVRGYDRHLFERYGRLLLRLGENLEAGKYLFLSGERKPEYEEPIRLFLARHGRKGSRQVIAEFPAAARLPSVGDYPDAVRRSLEELGVRDSVDLPVPPPARGRAQRLVRGIWVAGCIGFVLCASFLALMGIGIAIDWIWRHWF